MKRKITLLLAVVSMIAWSGCDNSDPPANQSQNQNQQEKDDPNKDDPNKDGPNKGYTENVKVPHYLLSFTQPDKFDAVGNSQPWIRLCYQVLPMKAADMFCYFSHEAEPEKYPVQAATYKELCERYGDLTYNKTRKYYNGYLTCIDTNYPVNNIVSINLISATDYDENHPAGTSLNDICDLVSASPREHIASGYTKTYDWEANPGNFSEDIIARYRGGGNGSIPFKKRLSECTAEDMVLMGNGVGTVCNLIFTHRPTTGQKQRFSVTLKDEAGTIYTAATGECKW